MLIPETPQPPSASFGRATINRISPTGTGTPLVRASGYLNIFCEGLERFPGCWDLFHFLKEEEVKVSLREVRDELNKRAPADLIRPWYARGKNRYYPEDHDRVSILVPLALVGTITYPYKWAVSCLSGHALPVTNPCVPRHFARTLQSNVRFSSPSILGVKVFEVTLNLCFAVDRRDYKTAFKLFADLDQLLNAYEGGPAMTPPIGKWYDGVKRILTYLERELNPRLKRDVCSLSLKPPNFRRYEGRRHSFSPQQL
ncbi:hypothetical protein P7C70_g7792, partial [Phenoliferia sp. Uapishka_3]